MEFARMLAAFSSRASTDEKLNFMFTVYDIDGDGEQEVEGCWARSS
jgi:Ca2+-binding EF-hand superfamily protein